MTNASIRNYLDKLAVEVPEATKRAGVGVDSCILSTKVIVEACKNKGIPAKPLPVKLRALSPELVRRINEGGLDVPDRELTKAGVWEVSIGHEPSPGTGWNGHLVALVKGRWMVDAALGQVNRPAKKIQVEPLVTEVDAEFFTGSQHGISFDNGTTVLYEHDPGNRTFLTAPSWTEYRYVDLGRDGFRLDRWRPLAGTASSIK